MTVQVVPAGIVVPPLTVNATLVEADAVLELLAGEVTLTIGGLQTGETRPSHALVSVRVAPLQPLSVVLTGVGAGPQVVVGLLISFDVKLIEADVHGTCGIVIAVARTRSADPSASVSIAAAEPFSGALTPLAPRRM